MTLQDLKLAAPPWRLSGSGLTVLTAKIDPIGGWPNGRLVVNTSRMLPLEERIAIARAVAALPALVAAIEAILPPGNFEWREGLLLPQSLHPK